MSYRPGLKIQPPPGSIYRAPGRINASNSRQILEVLTADHILLASESPPNTNLMSNQPYKQELDSHRLLKQMM